MAGIDTNTKLYLPFDQNTIQDGNEQSATTLDGALEILDYGSPGAIVTQIGTAQLDTSVTKFSGDRSSLLLDGNSDGLNMPTRNDLNIFGSTSDSWTIDGWVKYSGVPGTNTEVYFEQYAQSNVYYIFYHVTGVRFFMQVAGTTIDIGNTTAVANDGAWHHLAFVKKSGATPTLGLYLDGTQIGYNSSSYTYNHFGTVHIGKAVGASNFFDGNMGHWRVQKSNIYNATPNVGETDTITIPTAPTDYTVDANTRLYLPMETQDLSGDGGSGSYHIPNFIGTAQLDTDAKVGDLTTTSDSSDSDHTITFVNGCALSASQAKFGGTSLWTSDTSDYTENPDSADWDLWGDDTTLEFWLYPTSDWGSTDKYLFSQRADGDNRWQFYWHNANGGIYFIHKTGGTTWGSYNTTNEVDMTVNAWNHIAVQRRSGNFEVYLNGVSQAITTSTAFNGTPTSISALTAFCGRRVATGQSQVGFWDEIRISKGVARYTGNFTPATEPFESDADTVYLAHMNTDDYPNDTSSLLLDGNSDTVSLPYDDGLVHIIKNNADSTIDLWFRMASGGAASQLLYSWRFDGTANYIQAYMTNGKPAFYFYGGGEVATLNDQDTADLRDDTWHHCAVVRITGGAWGVYIDGQQVDYDTGTGTSAGNSASFFIGCWNASASFFDGHIAHFRTEASNIFNANPVVGQTDTITVPDAPYTAGGGGAVAGFMTCNAGIWG